MPRAIRTGTAGSAEIGCDLGFRDLRVVDRQTRAFFQQVLADADRGGLAGVVGVGLEGKAQDRETLAGEGAKQSLHHQLSDTVLLPAVELDHALPVGRHIVEAVMTADVNQIEDVLLEAAAAKAWACLQELGADTTVGANGMGHLVDIRSGGLAESSDRVDRADPLGQEGIGGQLGEL